jgi:GDP-L-fucose synthase
VAGYLYTKAPAITRNLQVKGFGNFIARTHLELDLTNQQAVQEFFQYEMPEQVHSI